MERRVFHPVFTLFSILLISMWGCVEPQAGGLQGPRISAQRDRGAQQQDFLGPQSRRATGELRVLMVAVRFPDAEPRRSLEEIKTKAVAALM